MEDASLGDVCAMLAACEQGQLRLNMRRIVEARAAGIQPQTPPRENAPVRRFGVAAVDGVPDDPDAPDAYDSFEDQYARHGARGLFWHKKDVAAVEVFAWIVAALESRAPGAALVVTTKCEQARRSAVVARQETDGVRVTVFLMRGRRTFEYRVQTPAHAAWLRHNLEKQGGGDSWIIGDEFCYGGRADSALVGAEPAH
jgi:hypothetical protein